MYIKSQTLRKKQENLSYVFIYKNPDTFHYAISHGIFEIGGGGGTFLYAKKNVLCVTFLYAKTMHFALSFYLQKATHFALGRWIEKNDVPNEIFNQGLEMLLARGRENPL